MVLYNICANLICVTFIGPAASASSPWPILFAPLAVVFLVLVIVAVAAIVYCKRRRRNLNLKRGQNKESSPEDSRTERVYEGWFIPFCSLQI